MNLALDITPSLIARVSAARVMSRPAYGQLIPAGSANLVIQTASFSNPFLDPIRANTFDAALEWYFRPGSLLSAAFFYKDISTYIQSISSQIPFTDLGLPNELLTGTNTVPSDIFTISQPVNTPGGPLKGIELNAQIPFNFLHGFLGNFGVLANYTHVISKINYCLTSVSGVCTVSAKDDLIGLSPNTASATLYYEDEKFSIRTTGNFRDQFIRGIPASAGSDLQGNAKTFYMDASASYNISDRLKVIVEATNLTDEQNRLYIDSTRQDTLFETRIGRTFTFGVNYRM